ncbi:hypothetical protein O181_017478 [Austropuccinia psidii MF-1]|uniref:Integrase zinc-binding domain-containing protein n=1 Tax=Austropuccinia psidii MF-1 TaxID=1389203 RepID=A0A9Q3C772_9BASI|nr:hypothetical protein [Austropuccinia psidii MF-1]
MEIERRKNLKLSEWKPEFGTLDSDNKKPEGTETPILGISSSELHNKLLDNQLFLIDGIIEHREKHTSSLTVIDRDHISLTLQECHDCPYMGPKGEDRTKERVASTAWWPQLEKELSEYIKTFKRFHNAKRKHEKRYVLLQHIEGPKHLWETINMEWVTGFVPGGKENFND